MDEEPDKIPDEITYAEVELVIGAEAGTLIYHLTETMKNSVETARPWKLYLHDDRHYAGNEIPFAEFQARQALNGVARTDELEDMSWVDKDWVYVE